MPKTENSALDETPPFLTSPIELRLKPSRQFPFLARHPWVHANALCDDGKGKVTSEKGVSGNEIPCGQVVDLVDFDGNWIARGLYNPVGKLRIRLYCFDSSIMIDESFLAERIDQAINRRRLQAPMNPDAAERLVFSESDLLSGLIVDRYGDYLSVQFTAAALLRWKNPILKHLEDKLNPALIMIRIDEKTAKHEGIDINKQPLSETWSTGAEIPKNAALQRCDANSSTEESTVHSQQPSDLQQVVHYQQNGLEWSVDLRSGQKTGGYLDQRLNHGAAAAYMKGRRVLDVCCYNGGFGLVALAAGAASVVCIDSSAAALEQARQTASRNKLDQADYGELAFRQSDCFDELKRLNEQTETFDAIILDPPRFAGNRKQVNSAIRAYRRLNTLAVDLLPPGGILVTCSCSGRVSRSDFLNMLLDVGRRRRRDLVVLENRGPAADHPVAVSCPESDYLKCFIAEVR